MTYSRPTPSRLGLTLRRLETVLMVVGFFCLAFVAGTLAEAKLYQLWGRWQLASVAPSSSTPAAQLPRAADLSPLGLESTSEASLGAVPATEPSDARPPAAGPAMVGLEHPPQQRVTLAAGAPVGTIAIPEAGVDAVILEGVESRTLRRGVGHFPDTPLPGAGGNFALAGHRDTFFRGLRHARAGQTVAVELPDGKHCYRIERTAVIEPTDVEVVEDQGRELLTLITCYPFRHVGPAPQRFLVQATPQPTCS